MHGLTGVGLGFGPKKPETFRHLLASKLDFQGRTHTVEGER